MPSPAKLFDPLPQDLVTEFLESFLLSTHGLKCLVRFAFHALKTNKTRVALAVASKRNETLESFAFHAAYTSIDNETRVALEDPLKHNGALESCVKDLFYTP